MARTKVDLRNPIYHDDDAARRHLEMVLWPQGPVCPRCGIMGERITKLQGKSTRPGVYKCKDCRKPFSVTVGTVMERSHIPLSKWLLATQLMASSKKSMSAHQLHRMVGTSYEAAWFMFHRLREAATDIGPGTLGGSDRFVEADETYVGCAEHLQRVADLGAAAAHHGLCLRALRAGRAGRKAAAPLALSAAQTGAVCGLRHPLPGRARVMPSWNWEI
jgi:transposase-like protein